MSPLMEVGRNFKSVLYQYLERKYASKLVYSIPKIHKCVTNLIRKPLTVFSLCVVMHKHDVGFLGGGTR